MWHPRCICCRNSQILYLFLCSFSIKQRTISRAWLDFTMLRNFMINVYKFLSEDIISETLQPFWPGLACKKTGDIEVLTTFLISQHPLLALIHAFVVENMLHCIAYLSVLRKWAAWWLQRTLETSDASSCYMEEKESSCEDTNWLFGPTSHSNKGFLWYVVQVI